MRFVDEHQDLIALVENRELLRANRLLERDLPLVHFLFNPWALFLADDRHLDALIDQRIVRLSFLILLEHREDDVGGRFGEHALRQCGRRLSAAAIGVGRANRLAAQHRRLAELSFEVGAIGDDDHLKSL